VKKQLLQADKVKEGTYLEKDAPTILIQSGQLPTPNMDKEGNIFVDA